MMKTIKRFNLLLIGILLTLLGYLSLNCPYVKYGPGPDPLDPNYKINTSSSNTTSSSSSGN